MDEENECVIEEVVVPSKTKKLKQALLSFSKVCPPKPLLDNVSSKKRKLESPKESKTAKIIKVSAKENSEEDIEILDNVLNESITSTSSSKNKKEIIDIENDEEKTPDRSQRHDKNKNRKSKSKKSLFSKSKKKESFSPNTSLTKFLMKKNKKDDINTSMDDNTRKKTEQKNISSVQNSNENSDIDVSVVDDNDDGNDDDDDDDDDDEEEEEIVIECTDKCDDTNKSLRVDSDYEIEVSSNDEDNTKVSEKKETTNMNVKGLRTPTQKTKKTDITKNKKVTPKQLQKENSARKRKEREQLRLEKERKREEERENRRREKEEKRKEKEEKERAEREQKKKEKEQKELKKQMEIEQKQKEKEAKEQERRKKEEERKRKEEEKLEFERKKQKEASTFVSFFVPKKQEMKSTEEENNTDVQTFMPFEVKTDMRVAPICRGNLDESQKLSLDSYLNKGDEETINLYLAEMKSKKIIRHKSEKTWPLKAKNDVIVLDDEENDCNSDLVFQPETVADKIRPKLLQFHENRRPPYWGTWRKKSDSISSRRPFSKDSKLFDYEVDSDEEWEEEEPGESLHGSEDEKDEENPDDDEYDVDNEFMVPHGYLSDEEARPDEEEDESMTPETQKFKLKLLGEQFEAERTAKMSKLKPRIIGCVWLGENNSYPENTPKKVVEFLTARHAWVSQIPVVLPSPTNENTEVDGTPASTRKRKVPTEALPDLIRLIHGNTHGKNFLVKEFLTFWNKKAASRDNQISKVSLVTKISEIGRWIPCPDKGQMHLKACWYVSEDIRKQYLGEDEELVLPNRWKYNLTPKRKSEIITDNNDKTEKSEKDATTTDKDKKKVHLITQFTKKITQEEMQRQLTAESNQAVKPKPILQRPPKRAVLISIPKNDKVSKKSIEEDSQDK
ncbi:PREDICTED: chromatin assembly factor 1 subunit A-like [Polistes dominula]|uniref:Chromatin assembly factor 1 subunit A-like n=1 Tax=Polistes dominula TaxID=743375 RepID=A0ABM1I6S9_POLDO|nr:PREDICTED: chromatin assembly factor 1 subunit A-like [Polistes dominula]